MKRIITVTLNPAFDLHYIMQSLELGYENYVSEVVTDAGGKGINISRALKAFGYDSLAYAVLGRENCAAFEQALTRDKVTYVPFYADGRIRENITLHPVCAPETRISLDSFEMNESTLSAIFGALEEEADEGCLIAFSGRLPKGIDTDTAVRRLCRLKSRGARIAVDCNSFSLNQLKTVHPWLIKPNEQELSAFTGAMPRDINDAAIAARRLALDGAAEQVMISLGGLGCVWSDGKRDYAVSVPKIKPISTVGAGDSAMAGYLAAAANQNTVEQTLALACAFGSAACLTEGTRPPKKEDVSRLRSQITVTEL